MPGAKGHLCSYSHLTGCRAVVRRKSALCGGCRKVHAELRRTIAAVLADRPQPKTSRVYRPVIVARGH